MSIWKATGLFTIGYSIAEIVSTADQPSLLEHIIVWSVIGFAVYIWWGMR